MKIINYNNHIVIVVNTGNEMEQAIKTAEEIVDQSGGYVRLENILGDAIADLDDDGWQYWNMF